MRSAARVALLMAAALLCRAERHQFDVSQAGEVIVELEMSSPGSDWAERGREAAVAGIRIDNEPEHFVTLYAGPDRHVYRLFAGALSPGSHELNVERNEKFSAAGAEFVLHDIQIREVGPGHADYAALAHAPVLFAREDTAGKFNDVPLLMYCEKLSDDGKPLLQYTAVFSNEDGGTSTRALMARWGRTTDIEYIYRVWLNADGSAQRATVQGRDHQELEYKGETYRSHPLLKVATHNNMVEAGASSSMRYQLAPMLVDLASSSREQVMDDHPATYRVMAKELAREKKIRNFGVAAGESVSDLRNYVFLEYDAAHSNSVFSVVVQLKDGRGFSSDLGRLDYAIGRDGWVRTSVELPPGPLRSQIDRLVFECRVAVPESGEPLAHSGSCRLNAVSKVFFLNENYLPRQSVFSTKEPVTVPTGQSVVFTP